MPASLVTGKEWGDMTETEKLAHSLIRESGYTEGKDPAAIYKAEQWLNNNYYNNPDAPSVAEVRKAAIDRINAGTFANVNKEGAVQAAQDAWGEVVDYRNADALTVPANPVNSAYDWVSREAPDISGLEAIGGAAPAGSWDNEGQVTGRWGDNNVTVWNPTTNTYETYNTGGTNDFTAGNGLTSYYVNEQGQHVLGFTPENMYRKNVGGNYFDLVEVGDGGLGSLGGSTPAPDRNMGGRGTAVGGGNAGNYSPPAFGDGGNPNPPQVDTAPQVDWDTGSSIGGGGAYQGGGQSGGQGGGYDWNWDAFNPGAAPLDGGGGYDPNDYAFDRYVPGQESPWGIPDIEGGNKDFYRNQFVNLLRGEQNFQNNQRDAAQIRQDAVDNPIAANPSDWSWLEGGLPEVDVGGQTNWDWTDNINVTPGQTTNQDIYSQVAGNLQGSTRQYLDPLMNTAGGQSIDWSQDTGPNNFGSVDSTLPASEIAGWNAAYGDLANNLFQTTGGNAPAGYASPVPGLGSGSGRYGYQQGGATSYFNPLTGAMTPL